MNALKRQVGRARMFTHHYSDKSMAGAGGVSPSWLNSHTEAVLDALESDAKKDAYLKLAEGVHKRQSLLLSYNIGIEADRRERDMNKRAARLVGLRLPTDQERSGKDGDDTK